MSKQYRCPNCSESVWFEIWGKVESEVRLHVTGKADEPHFQIDRCVEKVLFDGRTKMVCRSCNHMGVVDDFLKGDE
ncbi:MAG: hypothetical protein ACPGVG_12695 [Mycobacterium sp.]